VCGCAAVRLWKCQDFRLWGCEGVGLLSREGLALYKCGAVRPCEADYH